MKKLIMIASAICSGCIQKSSQNIYDNVTESSEFSDSSSFEHIDQKRLVNIYNTDGKIGEKNKIHLAQNIIEWVPGCISYSIKLCDDNIYTVSKETIYIYQKVILNYSYTLPCLERVEWYNILFKMPSNYLDDGEREKLYKEAVKLKCEEKDWLSNTNTVDSNQATIWKSLPVSIAPNI